MENKDIANLSLKGLKAFVQVCRAKSPEMRMLMEDLKEIIKTLEKGDSREVLECDKYITQKYPMTCSEAFRYNLRYMTEREFMELSLENQFMSLHKLAHFLEDSLRKETVETKLSTAGKEIMEGMLVFGLEKVFEFNEDIEKATR